MARAAATESAIGLSSDLGDRKGRGYFLLRSVSCFAAKKRGHRTLSDVAGLLISEARASGGRRDQTSAMRGEILKRSLWCHGLFCLSHSTNQTDQINQPTR